MVFLKFPVGLFFFFIEPKAFRCKVLKDALQNLPLPEVINSY